MSPHGYLGTDTGGKVATLETMAHHGGGLTPAVGYWAAKWDPSGSTCTALYYTYQVGDRYLNVTTLPMIYAALPLYAAGRVPAGPAGADGRARWRVPSRLGRWPGAWVSCARHGLGRLLDRGAGLAR